VCQDVGAVLPAGDRKGDNAMAEKNGSGNSLGYESLEGKVALVTGAARGIGRAIALELAYRGADIALHYRSCREHAQTAAEQIQKVGRRCLLIQGDVALKEDAVRVVQTVLDTWSRLDILVNNAGITRDKSLRKVADDEWADVVNVDLHGTYYCTSAALPAMMQQNFGRIINISSHLNHSATFGVGGAAATKGSIAAFTKSLALEMAQYNITANTVAPGFTQTEMLDKVPANILDQIRSKIPLQRFAQPADVARAAAFLIADGGYITGQQLNVNGGLYI
jgi:NAD(P)-dependent dehydrogenase (short-subunit alcohol dehydrogenase family)